MRIMIVDDHEVVRFGLNMLLSRQPDWEVVAEAGSVAEAIDAAAEHEPEVIVMDVRLRDGSGIEACRSIVKTHPQMKVVMLTSFAEDELIFNAISAGAVGYVLKQVGNDDLIRAIQTISRGDAMLDPTITGQVLAKIRASNLSDAFSKLSDQELNVLTLIAEGKTNKEIAADLYLGEGTVRNYVSNILAKLELSNRAEATAYAMRHNLNDYLKSLE